MKKTYPKYILYYTVLSLFIIASGRAEAREVFEENFNYLYPEQLLAKWDTVTQKGGKTLNIGTEAIAESRPYAVVGNTIIEAPLGETLKTDWTLSFDILHRGERQHAWVGLLDETGRQGYAAFWGSGARGSEGKSDGVVAILELTDFDATSPDAWRYIGKNITKHAGSGHISNQAPMAHFVLTWIAATGELTLTVDGVERGTAKSDRIHEFSKIAIKGTGAVYVDNIQLSTSN